MKKGDIVKVYTDPIGSQGSIGRAELIEYVSPAKGEVERGTLEVWKVRFLEGGDITGVVLFNKDKKEQGIKAEKGRDDNFNPGNPDPPDDNFNPGYPDPVLKPVIGDPPPIGIKPPKDDIPPQPPLETESKEEPKTPAVKKESKAKATSKSKK